MIARPLQLYISNILSLFCFFPRLQIYREIYSVPIALLRSVVKSVLSLVG